jgi:hypothetical protein
MLHRLVTAQDWEAGSITLSVPQASARQHSRPSVTVNSTSDSVDVMLAGRAAMLDVTFTAVPLAPSMAGKRTGAICYGLLA